MDEVRTEVVSDKTYSDDDISEAFSENQGAILWPRRSLLYRICFLSMLPLFLVFLVGFSSPFWMRKHQVDKYRGHYSVMKVDVTIGLWRVCEGSDFNDISDCTSLPDITSYMMACQAMLCLCFIFTFLSLVFGLYENCATRYDIDDGGDGRTKRPEMNAITAGVFGLIGVCMYGVTIINVSRNGEGAVHWAFPVTAGSVTGVIVCGILMAIANPISSSTQSFPGQVMSLSRQSSVHVREPSAQDRLVSLNDSQSSSQQPSGGATGGARASTQYGGTTMNSDTPKRRPQRPTLPGFSPFMPRSDSCLSSHVSSPDLYTSASTGTETYLGTDRDSIEGRHCTQVMVETHEIASGGDDDQDNKRNIRAKQPSSSSSALRRMQTASQRRSWHFDDRTDVADSNNLTDVTTNPRGTSSQRQQKKPPVPPRRDKQGSMPGIPISPEDASSQDLLELNNKTSTGFVTKAREGSLSRQDVTQDQPKRQNMNPFLDDCSTQSTPGVPPPPPPPPPPVPQKPPKPGGSSNQAGDGNSNTESWDNQPWPEPPPPHPPTLSESLTSDEVEGENSNSAASTFNNVPESLQYLPNSSLSRRSGKGSANQRGNNPRQEQRSTDIEMQGITSETQRDIARRGVTSSSKQFQENRQPSNQNSLKSKGQAPPVPIMREYDNPLFSNQSLDERRAQAYEDGFTPPVVRHTTATSFINPSGISSDPPPYHSVVNSSDPEPMFYRRHSGHYGYPLPPEDGRSNSPPKYARPRQSNGNIPDFQYQQPGVGNTNNTATKSRPRQVKREHQKRRNNNSASENHTSQRQHSPGDQYYGSSPDLMARSPRVTRKRLDATGGADGDSPRWGRNTHHREDRKPYGNVQPKKYAAGNFNPHWADSDL
ncbi:hypothetical protein ElyMa_004938500 [Elysia marginata]|uniref:Claudin n=1 Tax=Elysia marginata TaxID=1093978 RepID=A0AAV4IYN3_9GAST|nr:hypothetical protein ElyMa_004938500 [Elysia marginata]